MSSKNVSGDAREVAVVVRMEMRFLVTSMEVSGIFTESLGIYMGISIEFRGISMGFRRKNTGM